MQKNNPKNNFFEVLFEISLLKRFLFSTISKLYKHHQPVKQLRLHKLPHRKPKTKWHWQYLQRFPVQAWLSFRFADVTYQIYQYSSYLKKYWCLFLRVQLRYNEYLLFRTYTQYF